MSAAAARRYADALYELAADKNVGDEIARDMNGVRTVLSGDREMAKKFTGVRTTPAEKRDIIDNRLAAGAHPFVRNTLKLLVDRDRENDVAHFVLGFFERMQDEAGIVKGVLESALPMTEERVNELAGELSRTTSKRIVLDATTNTDLVGGIRLTLGSTRIDSSVKTRLDKLETRLKAAI